MNLTKKQILKFKEDEISLCSYCNTMTKNIIKNKQLVCGKCKRRKE